MPPNATETNEQSPTGRIPNWILGTIAVVALIGFSDCVFLLAKGISGGPIPCFITTGCDTVTTSPYSILFGVHLYAWGIAYYLSMGFLALLYWDTKKEFFIKILSYATIAGFIVSAYYMYIQKFVIKALCIYCITSALTSTILFALGMTILRKLRK
jgi:uncharacterized membrane protein